MAGIFDLKKGAFDSSEAARLHKAYDIALHGLRSSQVVDRALVQRLARSIVKVARSEPDCLNNDGSIEPARLAQRAILRMLQLNAPDDIEQKVEKPKLRLRDRLRMVPPPDTPVATPTPSGPPLSPAKVMLKIFDGTRFAKL